MIWYFNGICIDNIFKVPITFNFIEHNISNQSKWWLLDSVLYPDKFENVYRFLFCVKKKLFQNEFPYEEDTSWCLNNVFFFTHWLTRKIVTLQFSIQFFFLFILIVKGVAFHIICQCEVYIFTLDIKTMMMCVCVSVDSIALNSFVHTIFHFRHMASRHAKYVKIL